MYLVKSLGAGLSQIINHMSKFIRVANTHPPPLELQASQEYQSARPHKIGRNCDEYLVDNIITKHYEQHDNRSSTQYRPASSH